MNIDEKMLQDRVTLLEETAAHQSFTIDELSAQLAEQWTLIDHMRIRLDRLTEQFRAIEDMTTEAPANTKPPHY